jgi:tRNA A-37 threonylcarbamoyl transferase component Bud32
MFQEYLKFVQHYNSHIKNKNTSKNTNTNNVKNTEKPPEKPLVKSTENDIKKDIKKDIEKHVNQIRSATHHTEIDQKSNLEIKKRVQIKEPNIDKYINNSPKSILDDYQYIKEKNKELIHQLSRFKNKQQRLQFLESLKDIHNFTAEHTNSDKVTLIEGCIVKKKCFGNSLGNFMFWNEIKALMKLKGYPHFPHIIEFDPNSLTIYMTYCGRNISSTNLPKNWNEQVKEIFQIMSTLNVNSNDMLVRNVCSLNGEIKIIDFGLHTNFGKTISESMIDLKNILNGLSSNATIENHDNELSYQLEYPNWKRNLELYSIKISKLKEFEIKVKEYRKKIITSKK